MKRTHFNLSSFPFLLAIFGVVIYLCLHISLMEHGKKSLSFLLQTWRRVFSKLERRKMERENDIHPPDPKQHTERKRSS